MQTSIVATLAVLASAVAAGPVQARTGGLSWLTFGEKCEDTRLLGDGKKGKTELAAACFDDAGVRVDTTLNLNQCIGNDAGKLVWKDKYVVSRFPWRWIKEILMRDLFSGNYDNTCFPCGIDELDGAPLHNFGLKCNCLPYPNGVPKYTDLLIAPTGKPIFVDYIL